MQRAIKMTAAIAITAAETLLMAGILGTAALAQGIPATAPQAPNVTLAGPQRQQPPAQRPSASGVPRTAPRPVTTMHAPYPGTVEGFVYWDRNAIDHKPTNSCDGLSATVSVGNSGGEFTTLATPTNNFKYVGNIGTYAVCTYALDHVPVGQDLKVKVDVTGASTFSPISAPAVATTGPIKIINGKCNNLPPAVPSQSDLSSHWWTCGNYAYNVNFVLQPTSRVIGAMGRPVLLSPSNQTGMLSGTPQRGMLTPGAISQPQPASGIIAGSGNTPNPVAQNGASGIAVNQQPAPRGTKGSEAASRRKSGALALKLSPPKALRKLANSRLPQQNASIVAVLEKQKQVADQESAAMKTGIRPVASSGVAARVPQTAISANFQGNLPQGPLQAQDEHGNLKASMVHEPLINTVVFTCSHDSTPRILRVSGGEGPAVLTPEAKYNLYTIAGCSFGPSDPGNSAHIYGTNGFQANLNIDFWSENGITVHFDPFLAGVLDQNNVSVVVAPAGKQPIEKTGFKFYAARGMPGPDGSPQEVQMMSAPQSAAGLDDASPIASAYDQVTQNATSQFGSLSFQGTPVAGWVFRYVSGHGDMSSLRTAECFLNDVAYNDDTICTNFGVGRYGPEIGNPPPQVAPDTWDFSKMAPGFWISSYQLFTDNPDPSQLCGAWDGVNKNAYLSGNWDYNLNSQNQIVVNWAVNFCGLHEANFAGRNDIAMESSYGLAVWVLGPRCVDPWTGQKDQLCMAKVKEMLGS